MGGYLFAFWCEVSPHITPWLCMFGLFDAVHSSWTVPLNLLWPLIVLITWHWFKPASVNACTDPNMHNPVVKYGDLNLKPQILPPAWLKSVLVVTIADNEFQSQPSLTINSTNNMTVGQSSCCELHLIIQTCTIQLWNGGIPHTKKVSTHDSKVSSWWPLQTMNSNLNLL